jgi:hypothetical protein
MSHQVNDKVPLPGGSMLEYQRPPFALAMELKRTVAALIAKADIGQTSLGSVMSKAGGLTAADIKLADLKNLLATFLGSKELDGMLMQCMKAGSLINGMRITDETFETAEGLELFLPCAEEVGVRTLAPFFKHAASLWSGLGSLTTTKSPS